MKIYEYLYPFMLTNRGFFNISGFLWNPVIFKHDFLKKMSWTWSMVVIFSKKSLSYRELQNGSFWLRGALFVHIVVKSGDFCQKRLSFSFRLVHFSAEEEHFLSEKILIFLTFWKKSPFFSFWWFLEKNQKNRFFLFKSDFFI